MNNNIPTKPIFIIVLILSLTSSGIANTWHRDYNSGMKAIRKGEWQQAETYLKSAIAERGTPGKRLKTVGLRFIEYLPYYYLGVALYQLGRYKESVEFFEKSLSFGTIREFKSLYSDLERKLADCRNIIAPKKPDPLPRKKEPVTVAPAEKERSKALVEKTVTHQPAIKPPASKPVRKAAPKKSQPLPLPEPGGTGKKAVQGLMGEGEAFFRAGKLEASREKFSAVIQLDSSHADAAKWLQTIDTAQAVQSLNSGIRLYFSGKIKESEVQLREVIGALSKEGITVMRKQSKGLQRAYQFLAVILIETYYLNANEKSLSEARENIRKLKGLWPQFKIEKDYFSPKVVKEFSSR